MGWSGFIADYFVETCKELLEAPMAKMGFEFFRSWETGVTYIRRKDDIFIRFEHSAEDCPRYSLFIVLGISEGIKGEEIYGGVGLWSIIPEYYDFNKWRFSDRESLELLLRNIPDVLEQYTKPVLEDKERLSKLIDEQTARLQADAQANAMKFITREYEKARNAYNGYSEIFVHSVRSKLYSASALN